MPDAHDEELNNIAELQKAALARVIGIPNVFRGEEPQAAAPPPEGLRRVGARIVIPAGGVVDDIENGEPNEVRVMWDENLRQPVLIERQFFGNDMEKKVPARRVKKAEPTVLQYFGQIPAEGMFGIEVELEGDVENIRNKFWETKNDNSLRGGLEYVLKKPLNLDIAKKALENLRDMLDPSKIKYSFRTSVHFHVNVQELHKPQLNSFIYLSHLLEDILVNYCGKDRVGNRFCLRTRDAEWKVELLKEFIGFKDGYVAFDENAVKYSAINLATICGFGSVEFRSMRGTLDTDILYPFLDVLYRIRDYGVHNSIKEVSECFRNDPLEAAKEILGEHFDKFFYPQMEQDLKEAYCRLIELPYLKA